MINRRGPERGNRSGHPLFCACFVCCFRVRSLLEAHARAEMGTEEVSISRNLSEKIFPAEDV